jgi:hypothetical protein
MTYANAHDHTTQMTSLMSNVLAVALLVLGALPMIALMTANSPGF